MAEDQKIDLKKQLKALYAPSAKEPAIVEVPTMSFLMADGAGDPNTSPEFQDILGALYGVAYTLKFALKKQGGPDFAVMPPEGLWWADDPRDFQTGNKAAWQWRLMIALPDFVTAEQVRAAAEQLKEKKDPAALAKVRFESLSEGTAVHILHIGPYAAEGPTIERMRQFASGKGYQLAGKHHEIYLSDPRRVAPEKLKTILRHPLRRKGA